MRPDKNIDIQERRVLIKTDTNIYEMFVNENFVFGHWIKLRKGDTVGANGQVNLENATVQKIVVGSKGRNGVNLKDELYPAQHDFDHRENITSIKVTTNVCDLMITVENTEKVRGLHYATRCNFRVYDRTVIEENAGGRFYVVTRQVGDAVQLAYDLLYTQDSQDYMRVQPDHFLTDINFYGPDEHMSQFYAAMMQQNGGTAEKAFSRLVVDTLEGTTYGCGFNHSPDTNRTALYEHIINFRWTAAKDCIDRYLSVRNLHSEFEYHEQEILVESTEPKNQNT